MGGGVHPGPVAGPIAGPVRTNDSQPHFAPLESSAKPTSRWNVGRRPRKQAPGERDDNVQKSQSGDFNPQPQDPHRRNNRLQRSEYKTGGGFAHLVFRILPSSIWLFRYNYKILIPCCCFVILVQFLSQHFSSFVFHLCAFFVGHCGIFAPDLFFLFFFPISLLPLLSTL